MAKRIHCILNIKNQTPENIADSLQDLLDSKYAYNITKHIDKDDKHCIAFEVDEQYLKRIQYSFGKELVIIDEMK